MKTIGHENLNTHECKRISKRLTTALLITVAICGTKMNSNVVKNIVFEH